MNTIGCKICNLRKQNNMSQEQLAEKLNVSRQSVSKWERDETLPDIYNLEAIADVFDVSTDYLIKQNLNIMNTSTDNKMGNDNPLLTILSSVALIIIIISGIGFGVWYPTVMLMPVSWFTALIINTIKKSKKDATIKD